MHIDTCHGARVKRTDFVLTRSLTTLSLPNIQSPGSQPSLHLTVAATLHVV